MHTGYNRLRCSIEILSFDAELQTKWLNEFFGDVVGGGTAADYPNDELIMHFDDIYLAQAHMIDMGVLKKEEAAASDRLNSLIEGIDPVAGEEFWERRALFDDERWARIRKCAREVLESMPDRLDEKDWKARYWGGGSSRAILGA